MTFEFQDYWYIVRQKNKGYNSLIFLSEIQSCLQVRASYYSGVLFASLASQKTSLKKNSALSYWSTFYSYFHSLGLLMVQKQFNAVFNATAIFLLLPLFLFLFVSLRFIALGSHKNWLKYNI